MLFGEEPDEASAGSRGWQAKACPTTLAAAGGMSELLRQSLPLRLLPQQRLGFPDHLLAEHPGVDRHL